MKRFMRAVAAAFALTAIAAKASVIDEYPFVCPIGGEQFTTMVQLSGYRKGNFLDLKPYGRLTAPAYMPVCPGNGFAMYKENFTAEEVARLSSFVHSAEYQGLRRSNTAYFLGARLRRHMGEPAREVAYMLLKATWEAKPGEQYRRYALETLDTLQGVRIADYGDEKPWLQDQLVMGELERRLERFDDAKTRFVKLAALTGVVTGATRAVVELQLRLVESRNSQPEKMPGKM